MKAKCSTENLCDSCKVKSVPECIPDNVKFGDGLGKDNIIDCDSYEPEEA